MFKMTCKCGKKTSNLGGKCIECLNRVVVVDGRRSSGGLTRWRPQGASITLHRSTIASSESQYHGS